MKYKEITKLLRSIGKNERIRITTENGTFVAKVTVRDLDGASEDYEYVTADICFYDFHLAKEINKDIYYGRFLITDSNHNILDSFSTLKEAQIHYPNLPIGLDFDDPG